ncbi:MAG: DUF2934 domain-containing protein [Sedimentisphaerales bacterium]|nr:DUF2934 domain-containing protein [Sedimentisphaerales bacterium]
MGQRKGNSKKSTVATAESTTPKSKSEVTPLRPADKPAASAATGATARSQTPAGPTHEQIAQRAHELWVKNGSKHGEDRMRWLEAEAQLKREMGVR